MQDSIRGRLTGAFIGLAVGPLLLSGIALGWLTATTLRTQSLALQRVTAKRVAIEVEAFLQETENQLHTAIEVRGFNELELDEKEGLLNELLSYNRVFDSLVLLDNQGQEQLHLARLRHIMDSELVDRSQTDEFLAPLSNGKTYHSPIWFAEVSNEPLMTIAIPLFNLQDGEIINVLVSTVRIRRIWDLIADIEVTEGEDVYIVDANNRVVAHQDPSVVLKNTYFDLPDEEGPTVGLNDEQVILAIERIVLGGQILNVVAEKTTAEAMTLARTAGTITAGLLILALIIAGGFALVAVRQIVHPIQALATTAQAISAGDLSQQAVVTSQDELGILATVFNSMTAQLRDSIDTLEQRVIQRTKRLETVATLSGRLNAYLNFDELLNELVKQVKNRFGYYHVHVYILDEAGENLIIHQKAKSPLTKTEASQYAISLDDSTSLVAQAAQRKEIIWVNDVHEIEHWLPTPYLPDTRSEMVIPIMIDGKVLGVLDVQEDKVGGLDEGDANLLRSLANQVAVALTNARLFVQNQNALQEMETLYKISQRMIAATNLTELIAGVVEEIAIPVINRAVLMTFEYNHDNEMEAIVVKTNWYSGQGTRPTAPGTRYPQAVYDLVSFFSTTQPIFFENVQEEETIDEASIEIARQLNIRSLAVLPLWGSQDQLGVLLLEGEEAYAFKEHEIRPYLSTLAQLATELENIRLFEQMQKAKETAEFANQAKSEFLAKMSHELRTPLNGILGYAQILRRDTTLSRSQKDGITIIQQSGEHLLNLINDILDLSKIEARKMELLPVNFHLPNFLQSVTEICRVQAHQKGIAFTYDQQTPLPPHIFADEKRIRQVLLNLLTNAIKFTDAGQVTFRVGAVQQEDDDERPIYQVRFEIEDTGMGISPQQIEKIFFAFEQAGNQNQKKAGTGLGLPISQQLVQMMGGKIQVKSHPGEGSTFWFELKLPLGSKQQVVPNVPDEKYIIGYKGGTQKILVIDDKEYNRSMTAHLLTPLGFQITEANSGAEGIAKAQEIQPDLILIDLVMPGMTGIEATQTIRKMPEFEDMPIIAASASAFDQDFQNSMLAGCDGFISKPIQADKLFEILETHLAIEWIYDEPTDAFTHTDDEIISIPPVEDMTVLLDLAMKGNMEKIKEWAMDIKQRDEAFVQFADRLYYLAQNFQEVDILSLVEQHVGKEI